MTEFEKYINYLENQVKDEKNLSIAAAKKRTLDILKNYFENSEKYINTLQWEQLEFNDEIHELKNKIHSLEAILLIHGIDDFNMWLQKGNDYLLDLVQELYKKNTILKPAMMIEHGK